MTVCPEGHVCVCSGGHNIDAMPEAWMSLKISTDVIQVLVDRHVKDVSAAGLSHSLLIRDHRERNSVSSTDLLGILNPRYTTSYVRPYRYTTPICESGYADEKDGGRWSGSRAPTFTGYGYMWLCNPHCRRRVSERVLVPLISFLRRPAHRATRTQSRHIETRTSPLSESELSID